MRVAETDRAQHRLEVLVRANRAILGELSLTTVLRQIVESARELVGARYAALGVLGPDGGLAEFVHVGMDEETVRRIGRLPRGLGLLGVLVDDPRPLRVDRISDDPRSVGPPAHLPSMETFLGVPVKVRDVVYGNLYLTERLDGAVFSEEDQATLEAFGVSAGNAIENARLYEETRRRERWAEAAAAVSSVLLDPRSGDPLGLIAETVLRLTDGDVITVVVPTGDRTFRVRLARGTGAVGLEGTLYPSSRSVAALALETGRAVRVASREQEGAFAVHLRDLVDVGPVLALPLIGSTGSYGVLIVGRLTGRPPFAAGDLDLGESFAAQAAIATELAQAREAQQRLVVLQDRERIARDLHDHVIQRLFASGLTLEGLAGAQTPAVAARLVSVVDGIDATIRQLRTLIFRLQTAPAGRTLRTAVLDVTAAAAPGLGFEPDVGFEGPVDTVATDGVVDDVALVCEEALTNVARHARAQQISLTVTATPAALTVVVTDDGVGPGPGRPRAGAGLRDLATRARTYGGRSELGTGPAGGTELVWSIPLS
ncbi:GAF domain-containing sensor histidine kinase [Microlunatus spumicola]|uniref:GAF domain-containing sensor histidine kinase n=1 Tax=Microlunatus spumicola TaxID=81499 RepID=A0ABP6WG12_9ACTN